MPGVRLEPVRELGSNQTMSWVQALQQRVRLGMVAGNISDQEFSNMLSEKSIALLAYWPVMPPDPAQIRIIANFLGLTASWLLEVTHYRPDYAHACFDELWPEYEGRIPLDQNKAWEHVSRLREFKSQPMEIVKDDIRLILDGLCRPSEHQGYCRYPDCICGPRCHATGEMRGPEGW